MGKIYKGYELLQAIAEGNIKEGTEFKIDNRTKVYFDGQILRYKEDYCGIKAKTEIGMSWLTNDFEVLEDKIDIQSIEELPEMETEDYDKVQIGQNRIKINEILQWAKQIDKKITTKYCDICGTELTKENTALPNMCWDCKYGEE